MVWRAVAPPSTTLYQRNRQAVWVEAGCPYSHARYLSSGCCFPTSSVWRRKPWARGSGTAWGFGLVANARDQGCQRTAQTRAEEKVASLLLLALLLRSCNLRMLSETLYLTEQLYVICKGTLQGINFHPCFRPKSGLRIQHVLKTCEHRPQNAASTFARHFDAVEAATTDSGLRTQLRIFQETAALNLK